MMNRKLTDMSDADYSVEAKKAEFREKRKSRLKAMRQEGNFDEDGEAFKKAFDWEIMRRLLAYMMPYRTQLTFALLLLLAYSAIAPVFPSLIAVAVDNYIVLESSDTSTNALDTDRNPLVRLTEFIAQNLGASFQDERVKGLAAIVIIYMFLRILNFALRFGYTYLVAWLGQHIIFDIRKEMFEKIQLSLIHI